MAHTGNKQVFRMTISDTQILGTIEALTHYRSLHGLNKDATELLTKFQKEAISITNGTAVPAYINTGKRKESSINMESLGITEEDKIVAGIGKFNNPADLGEDVWAKIEREQKEWEAQQLRDGSAAAANIIQEDRRSEDRSMHEDSHPSDNDNVFAAFSKITASDL